MDPRAFFTYGALGLGALMIVIGLMTMLVGEPHPEVATGGATLMLATGLIRSNGTGRR